MMCPSWASACLQADCTCKWIFVRVRWCVSELQGNWAWDIKFPSVLSLLTQAWMGVIKAQQGVISRSFWTMKGYRGVIKGLWVRGLNCVLPVFALWLIFWLSRIHFRVHSPQGGNRCLWEDQRLVNVGIFGILHTNVWIWSGADIFGFTRSVITKLPVRTTQVFVFHLLTLSVLFLSSEYCQVGCTTITTWKWS